MGKSRRRERPNRRKDPISGRRAVKPPQDPEAAALRERTVLPAVTALASSEAKARATAASAIANLIEDQKCRKLLLREQVVRVIMEQTINDSDLEVAAAGWGVLRNLALEEHSDFSVHLYRQDILTPLQEALKKIITLFDPPQPAYSQLSKGQQVLVWNLAESLISVLSSLSETNEDIVDAISTTPDVLKFYLSLLGREEIPDHAREAVLVGLYSLTRNNEILAKRLVENSSGLDGLRNLKNDVSLSGVASCGILHNITLELEASAAENPDLETQFDSGVLPALTEVLRKYSAMLSEPKANGTEGVASTPILNKTVPLALEIISSVATEVGVQAEAAQAPQESELLKSVDGEISDESDEEVAMEDVEEEKDGLMSNGADVTEEDADMDLLDNDQPPSSEMEFEVSRANEEAVEYLIKHTTPLILHLTRSSQAASYGSVIYEQGLETLNNIAWAVCAATLSSPTSSIRRIWEPLAQQIWRQSIAPVLASETADIKLAESITGLAWAISRNLGGNIERLGNEHKKFMALYEAAGVLEEKRNSTTQARKKDQEEVEPLESIRPKCLGVLGSLAQCPQRVELNREIGAYLVTIVCAVPSTSPENVIEALNQLFDIYADKSYDYDEAVFWHDGFLGHLHAAMPRLKKMVKSVDKRKQPELRELADEAILNLGRFSEYKKEERAQANP